VGAFQADGVWSTPLDIGPLAIKNCMVNNSKVSNNKVNTHNDNNHNFSPDRPEQAQRQTTRKKMNNLPPWNRHVAITAGCCSE
jgi:hypothetical protein